MQPDRPVELRHGLEDRLERRIVERLAGDVGEDLDAAGVQLGDGAPSLLDRSLHVGHRHRRDEGRKALGMLRAQFGHRIVADAREAQADVAGREILDRRIGQRDDLAVVAELVHLAEALVEIEQLLHAAQPRPDVAEPRRDAIHLLEELVREDVAVDVDDRVAGHDAHLGSQRSRLPLRPRSEAEWWGGVGGGQLSQNAPIPTRFAHRPCPRARGGDGGEVKTSSGRGPSAPASRAPPSAWRSGSRVPRSAGASWRPARHCSWRAGRGRYRGCPPDRRARCRPS